jgi:hypothetical protein
VSNCPCRQGLEARRIERLEATSTSKARVAGVGAASAKPRKSALGRRTGASLRSRPGHPRFNKAKALHPLQGLCLFHSGEEGRVEGVGAALGETPEIRPRPTDRGFPSVPPRPTQVQQSESPAPPPGPLPFSFWRRGSGGRGWSRFGETPEIRSRPTYRGFPSVPPRPPQVQQSESPAPLPVHLAGLAHFG